MEDKRLMPLEDRELEWEDADGEIILIPAVDERWCETILFPKYYQFRFADMCPVKTWLGMMTKMNKAVAELLKLEYHRFWSQVVFDSCGVHSAIDNFLKLCPRITEPSEMEKFFGTVNLDKGVPQAMTTLYDNVFRVLIRMSTSKELTENSMSFEYFGQLLYDRSIFTIPRIIDLLCVYGDSNEKMVRKMVESISHRQPKYLNDLRDYMKMLIYRMFPRCEKEANAIAGEAVVGLKGVDRRGKLEAKGTVQLIMYSCDMINSLDKLCIFLPIATMIMYEEGLAGRFPRFYENVYKCMNRAVEQRAANRFSAAPMTEMKGRLEWFEKKLVEFIRTLIVGNILKPLTGHRLPNDTKLDDDKKDERVEDFIKLMTQIVDESELFAVIYEDQYPLEIDFNSIKSKGIEIDTVVTDHLNQRYQLAAKHVAQEAKNSAISDGALEGAPDIPEEAKNQNCLQVLKEMLPDYDDAFLWCCLLQNNWSYEQALDSILTKDLHKLLNRWRMGFRKCSLDAEAEFNSTEREKERMAKPDEVFQEELMSLKIEEKPKPVKKELQYIDQSANAGPSWQNETKGAPVLRPLLRGKKHDATFSDKDRGEVKAMAAFYQEHNEETRNSDEEEEGYNEYEDEYDDTYDSHTQGAMDVVEKKVEGTEKSMYRAEGQAKYEQQQAERQSNNAGRGGRGAQGSARGAPAGPREFTRGGFYTGGRDRLFKERRGGGSHNQKGRARAKYGRGMF